MTDSLGCRMTFGVIAPTTNISVQPEFDDMRPVGVTNNFSRIIIPDEPVNSNEIFNDLVMGVRAATIDAIDAVKTCSPGAMIIGMSAETFWGGKESADKLQAEIVERVGVPGGDGLGRQHECAEMLRRHQEDRGDHPLKAHRRKAG